MNDEIRVLHVAAETAPAKRLQRVLSDRAGDVEVAVATDAETALDRVDAGGIDCVVVDGDGGGEGFEFVASVRERRPEVPVLVRSTSLGEGVAGAAFEAGATDVLRGGTDEDALAVLERRIRSAVENRRGERRLAAVEERYRNLMETAPVPVAVHADGEFRYVNPAGAALLGAEDGADLVGEAVLSFVHPEDRELARDHLELALEEGQSPPVTERLVGLDGEVRHLRMAAARTTFEGESALQIVGQDLTEHEARRRELERERDRFSALFENVPNPAVEARYEGRRPVVTEVNEAFETVFGYDQGSVEGEALDDLIVPPDRSDEAEEFNERFQAGESVHEEVTRETADGRREFLVSLVPHETDEEARGFAIYTDITERERRERKLAALHEATRDLMDAGTTEAVAEAAIEAAGEVLEIPLSGVFLSDGDDELHPVAVTDAADEAVGGVGSLDTETVAWAVYESGDTLVTDDIREHELVDDPDTAIRSELIVPLGEHGVFRAASTERGAFSETDRTLASVLGANVEAAIGSAQRKTALRERRRQVERQNERLEEFASVVSHDLRNPLEQARGYLELARTTDDPDPDHFEAVDEALVRIEEIIDDVLTLARQGGEIEETEVLDLSAVVRECWRLVSTPEVDLDVADPPTVRANEGGLRQLLENVFRNVAEHADTADRIRVGALDDGFYVEDDGPGIPPEVRERAFDADYSAGGGTGFGLAIVNEIAEAHGWSVRIAESEAGGARFEFTGVETV